MAATPLITPSPTVAPIVTGHFRERHGYATWRPRGTRDYLLMLTLSGAGRVGWDGGERRTGIGEILLLRPGTPHDYGTARGAAGWELLWAHFLPREGWQELLEWPATAPGIGFLALGEGSGVGNSVGNALKRMDSLARSGLSRRTEFAMNALEEALLWCDSVNPEAMGRRYDPRIQRAIEYLRKRLGEPVAVADLASVAELSVSRLAHLFREQVGETPQRFLERERIARAGQLLSLTGRAVAEIAEEVGFSSPFYFASRFKKLTGKSPGEWRRQDNG